MARGTPLSMMEVSHQDSAQIQLSQNCQLESHSLLSLMLLETNSSIPAAVLICAQHDPSKMTDYCWLERSATIHWADCSPWAVGQSTASQSCSALGWLCHHLHPSCGSPECLSLGAAIPSHILHGTATLVFYSEATDLYKEGNDTTGTQEQLRASNQLPSPADSKLF